MKRKEIVNIYKSHKNSMIMADVIICLGNVFDKPKTIESMKLRTEKAVLLYQQKRGKMLIFTGGFKTRKDLSEAGFMSNIACEMGVSKKDIILEEKANTTIGNAYYSWKIMEKADFRDAVIVTSPDHLRRARFIFEKVMPNKNLEFVKSRSNLNIFESVLHCIDEKWSLLKLKIRGIDISRV